MASVYVAGSVTRIAQVRAVMAALVAAGHTITFDWTARFDARPEPMTADWMWETASMEARGVTQADQLIALPGGRGTATEIGMALNPKAPTHVTLLRERMPSEEPNPCPFDWCCDVRQGPEADWPRMAVEALR